MAKIDFARGKVGSVRDFALGLKTGIKAGTNITIEDDAGYAKIASSGGGLGAPDYDSGWMDIAQDEVKSLNHALGTTNVLVDLQLTHGEGPGICNISVGGEDRWDGYNSVNRYEGVVWQGLSATHIQVHRWPNDPYLYRFRLRMWKLE